MDKKQILSTYELKITHDNIHYMLINTKDKWVGYQIDRYCNCDNNPENKFSIHFFDNDGESTSVEYVYAFKEYIPNKFIITTEQEKDQITLIFVPIDLLLAARKTIDAINEQKK